MRFPKYIVQIMVSIDANERTICVVLIGQGKSQSISRKIKPGLPFSGQLGWVNKQGIMKPNLV